MSDVRPQPSGSILVTVPAHTTQAEARWEDPSYVANFCGPPGKQIEHCVGGETWIREPGVR